jgi:hypothetical protein
VATNALSVGIAVVLLHDHKGGRQPVPCLARKDNNAERGNSYSACDLEALAVCEAVKPYSAYDQERHCHFEG